MSAAKDRGQFTDGSVLGNIIRLGAPMTLALLINVMYNVIDRIYIGHIPQVGALALTGIGLAFPLTTVISAFQNLFSSGSVSLFSIARGNGDDEQASLLMNGAFVMLLISGIALTGIAYAVKEPVLWLIGADEQTFVFANDYLEIYLAGTVFVLLTLGMNPFFNAQGFSARGMLTVLIGAAANIILDPIFIFMLDMGVRGAAWATLISQFLSFLWSISFLTGKRITLPLCVRHMKLDPGLCAKSVSLGVTGFTMSVTSSAVSMLYNSQLLLLGGTQWVTAMTIINSLRETSFMAIQGFTHGAQPVMGYNYGAHRYDRVRRCINILTIGCLSYMLIVWFVLMRFPEAFIGLFNDDASLLPIAAGAIRVYFALTFFMSFQMVGQSVFTALGMTRRAIFFSLLRKVVLVIPLTLILPHLCGLGVYGILLSEPVSDIIGGTLCYTVMMITVYRKLKNCK